MADEARRKSDEKTASDYESAAQSFAPFYGRNELNCKRIFDR